MSLSPRAGSSPTDAGAQHDGNHVQLAILDPRGRFLDANDAFCRASGFARTELVGRSIRMLRSGAHPRSFWREVRRTLAAGATWQGEVCHRARDGSHFWVEATVTPDRDAAGRTTRLVAVHVDVSDRRRLADAAPALTAAGSATTPREFLHRVAEALESALDARGVVIAETGDAGRQLRSVAAVVRDRREDEFTLEVAATPFETIVHGGEEWSSCSGRAAEALAAETMFPGNPDAVLSLRLANPAGEVVGVLAVLDPAGMERPESLLPVLRLYAERIAAKLDRIRSDRGLRRLAQAIDLAGEAVLLTDLGGRPLYANEAFAAATGYTADSARELDLLATLTAAADEDTRVRLWRALNEGEPWRGTLACRSREGREFDAGVAVVPTVHDNGERSGAIAILRDVSEPMQRERMLQRQLEALQAMHRELAMARDAAEAASRAKTEFLANVGQDLRTSLNGLAGVVGMLLETPMSGEQQELTESARDACEAMTSGIDDIADFAGQESGALVTEPLPFDLRATSEDVVDHYSRAAARKGLELVLQYAPETPRNLIGDPVRVRQVLSSLVDNAVQSTASGHVLVSVDAPVLTHSDALVRVTVEDTGAGIPPERLGRLFDRAEPAKAGPTRRSGDPSLTLPAVKRLAEMMEGTVLVTSRPGAGTTVTATLRLAHGAPIEVVPVRSPLDGVRALVVDDVEIHRMVLRRQMGSLGMRVETAPDGDAALMLLREAAGTNDPFRLALIDNSMPGMSGEELGRALRADTRTAGLALMMFTATADRSEAKRFQQAGFDGFFVKPILPSMLHDALAAVLRARSGGKLGTIITQQGLTGTVAAASPARPAPPPAGEPVRVLLAEDNSINQKVATRLLEKLGYRVDTAATGREALERWRRGHHAIVFMDCQMPEMDGFEASRAIRKAEAGGRSHTPIIAMTASVLPSDREHCRAAGMDDFVAKPIREGVVRMVVRRTLERLKPGTTEVAA